MQVMAGVFALLAVFGVVAIALVVLRLEKEKVFILALIPVSGLTLAAIIAAVALVFRARRPPTPPIERHVVHTKERVLDGRQPGQTQVLALPGSNNALPAGLYPYLLRGAYQAGQHTPAESTAGYGDAATEWEGQIVDVDPE